MFVFVGGLSGGPDVVVLASPPKLGTCYLQIVAVTCYHFVGYYRYLYYRRKRQKRERERELVLHVLATADKTTAAEQHNPHTAEHTWTHLSTATQLSDNSAEHTWIARV